MGKYYQQEIECASREEIKKMQSERLVKTVKRAYENSAYYKKLMDEKGLTPQDVKSVDDLHKLPFIKKDDLREAYPYGLLAAPLSECVRMHSTSGTTGNPKGVYFTHRQLVLHTLVVATSLGSLDGNRIMGNSDVYMPITPMFHVHAWGMPFAATMLGLKQVYPGRYDPELLVELWQKGEGCVCD